MGGRAVNWPWQIMKIRRKRTVQETVQPKTQLPKSRPWVKTTPELSQHNTPSSSTVQRLPVDSREVWDKVSTLAPQENLYQSPSALENPTDRLYPKRLPRQDRSISPPHKSPLFGTIRRSPKPQSPTLPKHNLNWGHFSSTLQPLGDRSPITPWKPAHLLQRQPTIQRDNLTSGTEAPQDSTPNRTIQPPTQQAPSPPNTENSEPQSDRRQPPSHKAPLSPDKIKLEQKISELKEAKNLLLEEKNKKEKQLLSLLIPVDNWIEHKASTSGYSDIFYLYKTQGPLQRAMILSQLGVSNFSLAEAKSKLKSRQLSKLGRKGFDWTKFSDALQTIRAVNPWDETFIQDMSELGGAIAAIGSASTSHLANLVGGQVVADWSSEIGSLLGVVGLLITAYREYTELLANNDLALYKTRVGKLGTTLADIGRYTSTGLVTLSSAVENTGILHKLGSGLSTAAATSAAGAFAIVGGAINVGVGISQYRQAGQNQQDLEEISNSDDPHLDTDLKKGAKLGAINQGWDKKLGAARIAKGTAMMLGGALLLAGLGPVGWITLAVAGVIGGTVALAKYFGWRKRKNDFVDEELGVNERYKQLTGRSVKTGFMAKKFGFSNQEKARDQIRDYLLRRDGFVNADQYYYYRLNQMAQTILTQAQVDMQLLQKRDDLQEDSAKENKTKLRDYLQANDLNPRHYPGLCVLIGLGLKLTVKRIANSRLPAQSNIVTQLDYSK